VMRRVLVIGSRAWTDTATMRDAQAQRRRTECLAGWRPAASGLPLAWRGQPPLRPHRRPVNMTHASESLMHGPARVVLRDARAGGLPNAYVC